MKDHINFENIRKFAWVNDRQICGEIKGVIVDFFGMGVEDMYETPPRHSAEFAAKGFLHVIPYYNPWSWMNSVALAYTDRILDVLYEHFALAEDFPLVSCGASMGGLAALVYCYRGKRKVVACVTNCPVCDVLGYYHQHDDAPRTILNSFWTEGANVELSVKENSPLQNVEKLPHVPYTFYQCAEDADVYKHLHSDLLVSALQSVGHKVNYIVVPDSGHCQLNEYYLEQYYQSIEQGFANE